jgi:hypothetical protein
MANPKFKPGQIVEFVHPTRAVPAGSYEVIRPMPSETEDIGYRVRSLNEVHERFAWEHELRRVHES